MKYRMLSTEELAVFEEEFKQFLIVNGIHHEEWVHMNEKEPQKAVNVVSVFSDSVLQKVYERLEYLEFRSEKSCMVFRAGKDRMDLISLNADPGSTIDFSTTESIHKALSERPSEIQFFKTSKKYQHEREGEIHQMIEQGCIPSSSEFWNVLNHVLES